MRKMKRTKKKNMGLEERIKREQFLQELKNPTTRNDREKQDGLDILKKIRDRANQNNQPKRSRSPSPYDCGTGSVAERAWEVMRRKAGIK